MKLSDKLAKVSDNLTVNMYDNGYMVEVGGRDDESDWKSAKIMCQTLEQVFAVITEASKMERD
jgi:ketol-acid reductoisomerase